MKLQHFTSPHMDLMRAIIGRTRQPIYPKFAVKLELEYFPETYSAKNMAKKSDKSREAIMKLSGAERMIIGCQMFEEFRARIIASLPKDLPEDEFKKCLFERIYGAPMEEFLSGAIDDSKMRR